MQKKVIIMKIKKEAISMKIQKNIVLAFIVLVTVFLSVTFTSCSLYGHIYGNGTNQTNGHATVSNNDSGSISTKNHEDTADRCERFGHTPTNEEDVEPTCTKPGKTGRVYCSVCGYTITASTTIPATEHTPTNEEDVQPTCVKPGKIGRVYCSVCGYTLAPSEVIPATGMHENDGNKTCRYCGLKMNTSKETISIRTRDNTAEISFTGRSNQHYDMVELTNYYDFNYLRELGYDKLYLELSFNCMRLPTCYGPHFYIYPTVDCPVGAIDAAISGDNCLFSTEVSGMFYAWKDKEYNTYVLLNDLPEGRLYIRYGATSGIWKNRDVYVRVTPCR